MHTILGLKVGEERRTEEERRRGEENLKGGISYFRSHCTQVLTYEDGMDVF